MLKNAVSDTVRPFDSVTVGAVAFWEDSLKYLYLPRLKSREVLATVVKKAADASVRPSTCSVRSNSLETT